MAVWTFCTGTFAVLQPIAVAGRVKIREKVRVPAHVSHAA
jgi:hypothetical protein